MMEKITQTIIGLAFSIFLLAIYSSFAQADLKVKITPKLNSITVKHQHKTVTIQRNQNTQNRISNNLTLTSRNCPPHCLQPIKIKDIETIGELELLNYLQKINQGDLSFMLVDTRASNMAAEGTIPSSINIHGDKLIADRGANPIEIEAILTQQFAVTGTQDSWNFKQAKTLILYCYGIWCGQASQTLNALIELGYPTYKLKWYRGGIQAWESVGLTIIRAHQTPR